MTDATNSTDALFDGSIPATYERLLVPTLFAPFATDLAQRVAAAAPGRVLELAAGTGSVTREILRLAPDAEVTATDLSDDMLTIGRAKASGATWRQADALDLPFDDATFDLVVCQFGVMFFPDRPAGFAEARRVLRPGGRVLMYVWGSVAESAFASGLEEALIALFPAQPPTLLAAVAHGYHDAEVIRTDVEAGNLALEAVQAVTLEGRADSAAAIAEGYCSGTPMRSIVEAQGADLEATIASVADHFAERLGEPPVGEMTAYLIQATAPG